MFRIRYRCRRIKWPPAGWLLWLLVAPAQAQLLGSVPQVRALPVPPLVQRVIDSPRDLQARVVDPLQRRLLRRHPDLLVLDPQGAMIVRSEVVAIDPRDEALALARANGFEVGSSRTLDELDLGVVILGAPPGVDTVAALARLRELDPRGSYDFNHLYFGSAAAVAGDDASDPPPATVTVGTEGLRIGLIDSGVSHAHPALRDTDIHTWGCGGKPVPASHGTAVASLLSAPTLYAADIYCGVPTGGSATEFAAAMAWMARQPVAVINISLVGPDNALLSRATSALVARGYVLVAAVGNDGPAAAPLYPAAYPGVLGVTAVDARGRVLPEAQRGVQVDFAALGSRLRVADTDGGWRKARGTSYAAPSVARAAAVAITTAGPRDGLPEEVRARLATIAVDLGARGRDDTYGFGLVPAPKP